MHYAHALRAPRLCALALLAVATVSATFAEAAAPRISGNAATVGTVGVNYSFTPSASDADGNKLTFSIVNKPGFANFNPATGQLYGTPYAEHARTWSGIQISVSDGSSKVSLPAYSLVIKANANKSPTISGTPATAAKVGTAYGFTPSAADPEGKALTFSIRNKPTWATFSTSTGKVSGTPTSAGTFASIMIIVSDGVTSASLAPFTITASGGSSSAGNTAPTISGSPATAARVGSAYSFRPTASDANGDALSFSIVNKPSWATFSASTGQLSGTPSTTGAYTNIQIRVSDTKVSSSLAAFSITVNPSSSTTTGSASLSWTPPTRNTDGTSLTNLAGYRISYGKSSGSLSSTVTVSNAGVSSYVVDNLAAGTWYFSIKAYTVSGMESAGSTVASKSIQ